jgi:hypothetical protein
VPLNALIGTDGGAKTARVSSVKIRHATAATGTGTAEITR